MCHIRHLHSFPTRRSSDLPFGADELGRDVLSRIIWGTRASLLAGVVSVAISISLGVPIGMLAGYLGRSEEHTSELQSLADLVCRLLLEHNKSSRLLLLISK